MKRLLALLLLAVAPAFGQGMPPPITTYDPTVEQTYTVTQPQTPLQNINQSGGTPLTLYDDGSTFQPIQLPFDFYFFGSLFDSVYISQNGLISFTSNANGCCSGNELPFISDQSYYNLNNSIFAMWSDLADFNNPGNPYYKSTGNSFVVGWYDVDELGSPNKFDFEISLFADSSFSINYGSFDYTMATGRTFTSGFQGDTATEFTQFYWGNNPSSLQNTTYFVQSSEIVPLPPDTPLAPDCTTNPYDPSCVIDSIGIDDGVIDYTDPEEILAAIEEQEAAQEELEESVDDGSDDGSDNGSEYVEEEEVLVADEETTEEVGLEEMLQDEEAIEEEEEVLVAEDVEEETAAVPAVVAAYRELTDEEKAAILADAISKNTLEGALSIASDATAATSNAAAAITTVTESSSSRSSILASASTSAIEQEAASIEIKVEETKIESNESSSAAIDVLETGRQLGREALAATLAATEQSANESIAQAESIAVSSSETQTTATTTAETTSSFVSEEISVAQTTQEKLEETIVASSQVKEETTTTETVVEDTSSTTVVVAKTEETEEKKEVLVAQEEVTNTTSETETQVVAVAEVSAETESSTVVVENTTEQTVEEERTEMVVSNDVQSIEQTDTFAKIMQLDIKPVTEETGDKDVEFVQQLAATSNEQKQEETNNSGFSEEEKITIANDPALANAFNLSPNVTNLEVAGVLGGKQEEKSDAEKRADEVVAANAKEQEEINKNYMDADQSGIVAAMSGDTDVTSYRTAMIRDNNNWYKPEDIYKGVIIKDNVRGSYFLEKGNTDTYKKMIEEQYK